MSTVKFCKNEIKYCHNPCFQLQDFGGDTGSIYDNDLAIIKLNSPLVFGNEISPACLPESSFAAEEQGTIVKAVVSGWGKSKSGKYCVQFENFMDNFLDNVGETWEHFCRLFCGHF